MLVTPCSEVVWRVLATHCIRQFPLHFPSRASPCAITFQLESTAYFYLQRMRIFLKYVCRFTEDTFEKNLCFWSMSRIKYRQTPVSVNFHKTFMAATQHVISQQFNLTTEDAVSLLGFLINVVITYYFCRSQWPRGLWGGSVAVPLLRSWVRIPPVAWKFIYCVLSGRGLCDELITRPEDSYRL